MIVTRPALTYRVGSRQPRDCAEFYWGPHKLHIHRPEHPRGPMLVGWQFSHQGVVVANDLRAHTGKLGALQRFEQLARQLGARFPDRLAQVYQHNRGKIA